jgi:hypothetical protein
VDDKSASYAEMLGEEATAKPGMMQRVYSGIRSVRRQESYLMPTVVVPTANPVYETPTDDAVPVYEYDGPTAAADTNIYATPSEPSQGIGIYLDPSVDASTMNPAYETPIDDAGDAETYATFADPSMLAQYDDADDLCEATYASPAPGAFEENTNITSPKAVPKQVFTFTNETDTATSVEESTTDNTAHAHGISNGGSPTYQVTDSSSVAGVEYAVASMFKGEYANSAIYDNSAAPAAVYHYGTAPETANQTYSMASAEAATDMAGDALAAAESIDDDAYVIIAAPEYELGSEDSDPVYNCASDTPVIARPTPSYDPSPLYDIPGEEEIGIPMSDTASPPSTNSAPDYNIASSGIEGADATYSTADAVCVAVTPSGTDDTALERQRSNLHAHTPLRTLTQL